MASFSRCLAVDLGASAVRLLEIGPDSKGRPVVLAMAEAEVAFDPAKNSDFLPLYSQALQTALGHLPSKTRACHLCLGGPAVFSRILKVPVADPAKVGSMIAFEAQQTVPAIEQAFWDRQILPSAQVGEVEALILAMKKDTVEELSAAALSVGLKLQGVTLAPAALLNAFFYNYPDASGCNLILEVGARATTILLVEGSRFFVRVVPMGGATITQSIATDLQESFAGAEVLKRAKGFVHPGGAYEEPADGTAARISKLARGVMTRLHADVERSITFFRGQQGGGKPTHVWLAGAGVSLGYSDLFFREKLKIPVDYFQPFRRLALAGPAGARDSHRDFFAWGAAVGTALQALPELPVRINVRGAAAQGRGQSQKDRLAILLAGVGVALLAFLPAVHGFWQAGKTGSFLDGEQSRVEQAEAALVKLDAANKKFQARVQDFEAAIVFSQERLRWPRLLQELKLRAQPRLWITSLRVINPKETEGTKSPANPPAPKVEVQGMFETQSEKADSEAVEKFKKALETGGVLQNVRVLEREAPKRDANGKTEQVALKFRLEADWPISPSEKSPKSGGGK